MDLGAMIERVSSRRGWGRCAVLIVTGLLIVSCAPSPSPSGISSVGPHQRFRGLVNGSSGDVVVTTACGGPVWAGRTGPPVSGQTLEVVRDDAGAGDTGSSSVVFAQPSTASMTVVAFDTYGTQLAFPTDVQVPCDGTGTVTFTPCFGVAPCFADAKPDVVEVRFVNIAD